MMELHADTTVQKAHFLVGFSYIYIYIFSFNINFLSLYLLSHLLVIIGFDPENLTVAVRESMTWMDLRHEEKINFVNFFFYLHL